MPRPATRRLDIMVLAPRAMSIPMKRLQRVDRVLGGLAYAALQPVRWTRFFRRTRPVKRVLLMKFWGMGSLQLLTPAVRSLRQQYPGARFDLLTLRQNRAFAEGLGAFDRVLTLEVQEVSWTRVFARILRLVLRLRRERYDVVYDFEFFTRFSAVVSLLSGAPTSHGFASPESKRGGFHTRLVPFNRYWHVARNFRSLAGGENGLDVEADDVLPFRVTRAHQLEFATALFEEGFAETGPIVVLNPNAGSLSHERRWPTDRFAALARRMVDEDGARIVLIGCAQERARAAEVIEQAGAVPAGRIVNLSGRLSIGASTALLRSAEVFLSNDSGPMHIAAAQGVATIGLFGPETPVMYAPLGPRARWLYRPPACSPCINVHDNKLLICVRGRAECMTNLDVEQVLAAARAEFGREKRLVPAEELTGG